MLHSIVFFGPILSSTLPKIKEPIHAHTFKTTPNTKISVYEKSNASTA